MHLAKRLAVSAAVVALGGLGVAATQVPAEASTFTATYTCTDFLGTQTTTISGTLTASPNPATANSAVSFVLDFTSSLTSPVAINSWSATGVVNGSGAETSSFNVTGSGGAVAANAPISGTLTGSWTPTASGTDTFTDGDVTVTADAGIFGNQTVNCTPTDSPTTETLTVN
jgi:hypothetical protein